VYHPELYPDLAQFNPSTYEFPVRQYKPKRSKNPQTLRCSVVERPSLESTGYQDLSYLLTSDIFQNRGLASSAQDMGPLSEF